MIDTNVLLDVMTQDARWFSWSAEAIERAADHHRLVINPIIYRLMTRDWARYRTYFPKLALITPGAP